VRDEMGLHLLGYVVMPEHVHLLMSEPPRGTPSTVLQKLKLRVARFYDFNLCSEGKKKEKLNHMHANPVIRGLVKHPRDWPWSSWGFCQRGEAGLVAIDVEE
jgi:putative transposase